ncbi:MAG TPA: peptidylprolyl isomerase [Longimicrobiales bacterium]|nr:peptidylprolyl isomerase [Longimicrobiales bacterium]
MNSKCVIALCAAVVAGCGRGGPCGGPAPAPALAADHVLLDPDAPALKRLPPDSFDVRLETTQGVVVVRIYRDWAPMGVYRFYNLARNGFYDGARFFRVLEGFAAQFGASGRPQVDQLWGALQLPDDPPREKNRAGTLAYAKHGSDSRTTQLFFNYRDNEALDAQGFAPIGMVTDGLPVLRRLYAEYGDAPPQGSGPAFGCILTHGNAYLDRRYPRLDRIERMVVLEAEVEH